MPRGAEAPQMVAAADQVGDHRPGDGDLAEGGADTGLVVRAEQAEQVQGGQVRGAGRVGKCPLRGLLAGCPQRGPQVGGRVNEGRTAQQHRRVGQAGQAADVGLTAAPHPDVAQEPPGVHCLRLGRSGRRWRAPRRLVRLATARRRRGRRPRRGAGRPLRRCPGRRRQPCRPGPVEHLADEDADRGLAERGVCFLPGDGCHGSGVVRTERDTAAQHAATDASPGPAGSSWWRPRTCRARVTFPSLNSALTRSQARSGSSPISRPREATVTASAVLLLAAFTGGQPGAQAQPWPRRETRRRAAPGRSVRRPDQGRRPGRAGPAAAE